MSGHPGAGDDHLVSMANQIARFFASQKDQDPATAAAEHLRLYWEPRMKRAILARLEAGGAGMDPVTQAAVALLQQPQSV